MKVIVVLMVSIFAAPYIGAWAAKFIEMADVLRNVTLTIGG